MFTSILNFNYISISKLWELLNKEAYRRLILLNEHLLIFLNFKNRWNSKFCVSMFIIYLHFENKNFSERFYSVFVFFQSKLSLLSLLTCTWRYIFLLWEKYIMSSTCGIIPQNDHPLMIRTNISMAFICIQCLSYACVL